MNPKFFNKNFITSYSQISDSAGTSNANKQKLYDRNNGTYWYSLGETAGTSTITWTPGSATTVTRIIIQNCNWKSFTAKYNTNLDFSPAISVSNSSSTDYYIEVASQSINDIVFSITDTHSVGDTRKTGQIIITTELMEFASTYGWLVTRGGEGAPILEQLSDKTYYKTFIRDIVNFNISLEGMSATERDNFKIIYKLNKKEPVFFIDAPKIYSAGQWDGVGGHYQWGNTWNIHNWLKDLEANGYTGTIELYQAAGIS